MSASYSYGALLRIARTTLDDAAIKALPTAGTVTLVDAPGAGLVVIPVVTLVFSSFLL